MLRAHLTPVSSNSKTGPIPVSTTSRDTCPDSCALKGNGCYAEATPLRWHWDKVSDGCRGADWDTFCAQIAALPAGQLWRHNQAGDLPGAGDLIDLDRLGELVLANVGRRGFTYTHYPVERRRRVDICNALSIEAANLSGFTVNLSANSLSHADRLANLDIAPVVTVLPSADHGKRTVKTPAGRTVSVCPATYRDDVTCASCQLCQRQGKRAIVGFPAHGTGAKRVDAIANQE